MVRQFKKVPKEQNQKYGRFLIHILIIISVTDIDWHKKIYVYFCSSKLFLVNVLGFRLVVVGICLGFMVQ